MDFAKLAKIVAPFAPLIGSVLPIPGGAAIGQLIAHEFGGSVDNPNALAELISADPNAEVKLTEIQSNCKVQLQQIMMQNAQNELVNEAAEIESDRLDRADARKNNAKSYMPEIVTFIIITGFMAAACMLLKGNVTDTNQQVLFMMLGTISTAFGGAVSYWLGSSSGSRMKDQAIHNTLANLSGNDA